MLEADRALYYEHANVDDKLYDPRSGLGIFYRWKVRDIASICRMHHARPCVHLSVLERIAHGTDDYAPGNLPSGAKVVITPTDAKEKEKQKEKEEAAEARAKGVEGVLRSAHAGEESLLPRVRSEIGIGLMSYYLYVGTFVFLIVAVSTPDGIQSLSDPLLVLKNMALLIYNIVTLQIGEVWASVKALAMSPGKAGVVVGGFLLAYVLMLYADSRMSTVFSQFWHRHHARLREALKAARKAALEAKTGKDVKMA